MPPKQEVTQESRQISQSSGSNAMHGTGTVTAMMTGTWMISVGWEDKDQGKREKEQDKVDIYVNAPTHQDTLVRSLKDIMDLDSQVSCCVSRMIRLQVNRISTDLGCYIIPPPTAETRSEARPTASSCRTTFQCIHRLSSIHRRDH